MNVNPVGVERGSLETIRHALHLYGSGVISGIEDERANIIAKDSPIALIGQGTPRILRVVNQKPSMKTKWI